MYWGAQGALPIVLGALRVVRARRSLPLEAAELHGGRVAKGVEGGTLGVVLLGLAEDRHQLLS